MNRRSFLRTLAGAALAAPTLSFTGKLFAAPARTPRLLLVFLRGGYDCNSLLIPYKSDFYYQSRPTLAIAPPDPSNPNGALALDADWGLHPSLRTSLFPMWQRKQLAFVPFAGTDDLSRSHFETQDTIERGEPLHRASTRSGFMARLAGALAGVPAMSFTNVLPLCFQGGGDVPNLSLRHIGRAPFDPRQAALLAGMYRDTPLAGAAAEGLALRAQVSDEFADEMTRASRGAGNARDFVSEIARVAELMRDRYRLGFIDVGGWDTHVGQGSVTGPLANNLAHLGEGLAAYAAALDDAWDDTAVVVLSEFGRTFRENGGKGTDHGHGTVHWFLGGAIQGGRIAGAQVSVSRANLFQDRDHPVLNPYRDVLGGVFSRLFGLSHVQIQKVFPEARPADLKLV